MTEELETDVGAVDTSEEEVVDTPTEDADTPDVNIDTPESVIETSVPDKYSGKTVAEVIEMHQNLERLLGLPAEKRVEKMRQEGYIEPEPEEYDIPDGLEVPDINDTVRRAALSNLRMLNESNSLGLKFNPDGSTSNFNPDDPDQAAAWEIATRQAQTIAELFEQQMKPIQRAIGKKGISNEIVNLASEINGTDTSEVLKSFSAIDQDLWKSYSPEMKKFVVQDRAKAIAYDLIQQGDSSAVTTVVAPTIISKPKHEAPLSGDIVSKVAPDPVFDKMYQETRANYQTEIINGILTDADIKDIVRQTIGAKR